MLRGESVRLVPLAHEHHDGLVAAARDGELWRNWWTSVPEPQDMRAEIDRRLGMHERGAMIPFVQLAADGEVLGMTSFHDIDPAVPRREIGYTWLRRSAQGTGVNTEAKLLLLTEAFEAAGCECVGFRTQWVNRQSQRAIEALGARRDGVLRSYQRHRNGALRDIVMYSILRHEWPATRALLQYRLGRA